MRRPLLPVLLLVAAAALAGCGDDGGDDGGDDTAKDTGASGVTCDYPTDSQAAAKDADRPTSAPSVDGQVQATMETSLGTFELTLDADEAPCTVNSFVSLAQQNYYNDTPCHRLTTQGIFVLQCGDPTGTGTGGPGYTIPDEVDGSETYPAGTLAMAKTVQPDSGGSQFFIVYQDTQLPPDYTVFGTVDDATVGAITDLAALGTDDSNGPGDGAPAEAVEIESVTIQ